MRYAPFAGLGAVLLAAGQEKTASPTVVIVSIAGPLGGDRADVDEARAKFRNSALSKERTPLGATLTPGVSVHPGPLTGMKMESTAEATETPETDS